MQGTMYYCQQTSVNKSPKVCPFVCQILPFVGPYMASVFPFVRYKRPFVGIKGFTLVELIVVLTIAGILVAIAGPSMQRFVTSNRLTSQVNDVMADINLTRSEAIKRAADMVICVSTNGTSCAVGGNWTNGWIIFFVCPTPSTDPDCPAGTNRVIKTHEALTSGNRLTVEQIVAATNTPSATDTVTYSRSGSFSTVNFRYRFTVCDPARRNSRIIDVSVLGQTAISSGTCV